MLTRSLCCLLVQLVLTTLIGSKSSAVSAFVPPQALAQHSASASASASLARNNAASTSPLFAQLQQKGDNEVAVVVPVDNSNNKNNNLLATIWNRMDTLEASGINKEFVEHPPLVSRGGGFKRFMVIMAVGMAYKWYRARFINKIPFWEKQPQWNMVVTNKEQEDALRAYTCLNCGSSIFIARNREWYFEGGTGIGGLGCYACGAKGKDNFVMDRERLKEEVGDEDDYFDFERPLDFVTAAERKQLLKETAGDEEAANQMLVDQAAAATSPVEATPMFGLTVEEAEAKKVAEVGEDVSSDDGDDDAVKDDDSSDEGEDDAPSADNDKKDLEELDLDDF